MDASFAMGAFAPQWNARAGAAARAVADAAPYFREKFGAVESRWKPDGTRVTDADIGVSERIFAALSAAYPDDDFCSEEGDFSAAPRTLNAEYAWVLDPVDGTNNYAIGFPNCCISLALLRRGMPVFGVIYDHGCGTFLCGGSVTGLFVGGRLARVKNEPLCPQSLFGIQFPLKPDIARGLLPFLSVYRLRSIGSTALNLAHAAQGRLDGAFGRAHVWDFAAGLALVQAGGGETYFAGEIPFPLTTFHPSAPSYTYFGGSAAFCQAVRDAGFVGQKMPRFQ